MDAWMDGMMNTQRYHFLFFDCMHFLAMMAVGWSSSGDRMAEG